MVDWLAYLYFGLVKVWQWTLISLIIITVIDLMMSFVSYLKRLNSVKSKQNAKCVKYMTHCVKSEIGYDNINYAKVYYNRIKQEKKP